MMKFYSNNCQKSYEVVKLYDVRLLLLLELGELGGGYMQREWMIRGGMVLSQHCRETQDREVQRWVYDRAGRSNGTKTFIQ